MTDSDMRRFRKFILLILLGIGATSAQENIADTSSYIDNQGRTILIIRQIKNSSTSEKISTAQSGRGNGLLEKSIEMNSDRAEVDSVQIYQYLIQKYKREGRAKNSGGSVFLVVGGGLGALLAGAGFSDGKTEMGVIGCVIGAIGISVGTPLLIIGNSRNNKAKRYQEKQDLYKMTHPESQLTLRATPFVDPVHEGGGFKIALAF